MLIVVGGDHTHVRMYVAHSPTKRHVFSEQCDLEEEAPPTPPLSGCGPGSSFRPNMLMKHTYIMGD